MQHLANALAIAVDYLDRRTDAATDDDDVQVLEALSAELQDATCEERRALTLAFRAIGSSYLVESFALEEE